MNDQSADLAARMASRICHDLVSPVGAIANGLELLEMSGAAGPELDLIADSVRGANTRLKLFRIAFGAASADQGVSAEALGEAVAAAAGPRLSLTWRPTGETPRPLAKRLCLGLMCLESALPYGGDVAVSKADDGFLLSARAERQRDCPELWAWLAPTPPEQAPEPASLHFALLAQELAQAGVPARLMLSESGVSFHS